MQLKSQNGHALTLLIAFSAGHEGQPKKSPHFVIGLI
ncbi:MAG: hypothetical protein ACJAZP_000404 [Psychromonas sp.]|jgi:hypothetical protein